MACLDERLITGSTQNSFDLRYEFGSGVPIPSGAGLCIDTNSAASVLGAHFHGYLVKDK